MSFWSRLGDVANRTASYAFSIGQYASIGSDWGLAKAIGNDDDAKQAVDSFHALNHDLAHPTQAAQAATLGHAVNEIASTPYHYVGRGGSTLAQVTQGALYGSGNGDDNSWSAAWQRSKTQSLGQSVTNLFGAQINFDRQKLTGDSEAEVNAHYDELSKGNSLFNIARTDMTDDERQDFFHGTAGGKFTSGTIDFTTNLLLDPANLIPGAKEGSVALRAGEKVDDALKLLRDGADLDVTGRGAKAAVGSDKRTNYVAANIESFIKSTDGKTVGQLVNHPVFKDSADSGALASAFADANRIEDPAARLQAKLDIYGVGLGDTASMQRLAATRADLADNLARMTGPNEATNLPTFVGSGDGTLAALNTSAAERAFDARRAYLSSKLDQADRLWAVKGTTGTFGANDLAMHGYNAANRRLEMVVQDGTTSRAMRFINEATARQAPGYINVHDTVAGSAALRDTLAQTGRMTPARKQALMDEFIKAPTAVQRAQVVRKIEAHMWSGMATKENLTRALKGHGAWPASKDDLIASAKEADAHPDIVKAIQNAAGDTFDDVDHLIRSTETVSSKAVMDAYGAANKRAAGYVNQMKTRSYSANPDVGKEYTSLIDEEGLGHVWRSPFMRSQLENSVKLSDPKLIERALRDVSAKGFFKDAVKAGREANDMRKEVLSFITQRWKDSALMRVAYPVRVQVDTQLRLMAQMQGQYFISAAMGVHNLARNIGSTVDDIEDVAEKALSMQKKQHLEAEMNKIINSGVPMTTVKVGPGGSSLEDFVAAGGKAEEWERFATEQPIRDDVAHAANQKALNDYRSQIGRLDRIIEQPTKQVRRIKSSADAYKRGGVQDAKARAGYQGFDLRVARSGAEQDVIDRIVKGDNALASLGQELADRDLAHYKGTGEFDVLHGNDPGWASAYKRSLNHQIANSPVAMQTLRGSSLEELRKFVRSNADAGNEWAQFRSEYAGNLDEWLSHIDQHLATTIPDQAVRERLLEKGAISDTDIKRWYANTNERPDVHGEAFVPYAKSVTAQKYNAFRTGYYKWANEIPENVMGRHPLYVHSYQNRLKEMIDRIGGDNIDSATFEELRKQASVMARKDITDTLFDMSHSTNLAHMFKFISPFYSAWEDTMTKWGKLFYDDPKRAVIGYKVWQSPDQAGLIQQDQNGDSVIVVPKKFGLPGVAGGQWTFKKNSFNIIFQGADFWNPGVGPLVQIPVNELAKRLFPEASDNPLIKHLLLPYGISSDNALQQMEPAYLKRLATAFHAPGTGDDYAKTYALLMAQEQISYDQGKRKSEPSYKEIAGRTRNWYLMRAMVQNASPVTAAPSPRLQFYVDQAHDYQRKYAGVKDPATGKSVDWQQKFYDDFPDYYDMAVSLTTNNTGVNATDQAWKASQKYRDKIAEDPQYGWYYAGADNLAGDFSQGVYAAQESNAIGAGTDKRWRESKDPNEAVKDIEASKGWIEYNKMQTSLNLALKQYGLTSLNQKAAAPLLAAKQAYVAQLTASNPNWADAYAKRDSGKVADFMRTATKAMSTDKTLSNRSDGQTLQAYLAARRSFKEALKARGLTKLPTEGSKNGALADAWNGYVQQLVESDIGFEQMYNRVLESDDLTGDF